MMARKVNPATADVEADGAGAPDPRAGRCKGLCCTLKGKKAKRQKGIEAQASIQSGRVPGATQVST